MDVKRNRFPHRDYYTGHIGRRFFAFELPTWYHIKSVALWHLMRAWERVTGRPFPPSLMW